MVPLYMCFYTAVGSIFFLMQIAWNFRKMGCTHRKGKFNKQMEITMKGTAYHEQTDFF